LSSHCRLLLLVSLQVELILLPASASFLRVELNLPLFLLVSLQVELILLPASASFLRVELTLPPASASFFAN
jgi:hypothetical protein